MRIRGSLRSTDCGLPNGLTTRDPDPEGLGSLRPPPISVESPEVAVVRGDLTANAETANILYADPNSGAVDA